MNPVIHGDALLRLRFDDEGLVVRPWLFSPLEIGWREVEFVCPVPTLQRGPDGWQQKPLRYLSKGFRSTLESSGRLVLYVVVRDRRPILARTAGPASRAWATHRLRPMLDASDQRKKDQSLLRLDLFVQQLGGSLNPLFDLLAAHCRFDLVAFQD